MELADILKELGRTMRLGPLGLDGNGVCRLVFDDELVVDVEHVPARGVFYLHAVVGPAPAPDAPILSEMLAANLFGQGTGDATLALDRQLGETLLLRGFPEAGTEYPAFAAALETFLRALETWRGRLASGEGETPAARATTERAANAFAIRA